MPIPVARLRHVLALVGRFPVLTGVDFDAQPGEVVLVRGPNGAGKTSLLRVMAGLLPVNSGEAEVLGHDLRTQACHVRREVGLFGHDTGLYDDLSVRDNIIFAVKGSGGDAGRIEQAMTRLGLHDRLADTSVHRLSAGQRRRTALAILMARSPKLWLLDEPHAGLDAEGRDELDQLVREHTAASGTVVFASHETDRADGLADRIVTIVGGRVHDAEISLLEVPARVG